MIKLLETPEETTTKLQCLTGLDCCLSEDKRNCHIYVTSIMIITFIMFLHKQRTLSAVIFLFVPLVLSLLCVYYIRFYNPSNIFARARLV